MILKKIKIGNICKVQGGFAFKSKDYQKKGVPLIRISNIMEEEIELNKSTIFLPEEFLQIYPNFIVTKGDILIALSGATTGKFGIYNYNFPSLLNQRVGLFKISSNNIQGKLLYYLLKKIKNIIYEKAIGVAQPNISPKEIEEILIPDLTNEQQNKFLKLFELNSSLLSLRKKTILQTFNYINSVFSYLFIIKRSEKWERIKLKEIIHIDTATPKLKFFENHKLFVGLENIQKGTGLIKNVKEINQISSSKFVFNSNHILYGKLRPNLNKVALPDFEGVCSTDIFPILPINKYCNKYFVAYLLRHSNFLNYASKNAVGINLPRINREIIENYTTVLPPIEIQNYFKNIVLNIQSLQNNYNYSLEKIKDLYSSILQKAFSE